MAESVYTQKVVESFDRYFSKEIIAGLSGEKAYMKYRDFFNYINFFRYDMTQQYAQLVLSGDHLIHETNDIDTLLGRIDVLLSDELNDDRSVLRINEEVEKLLKDIQIATKLIKYHVDITRKYFDHTAEAYVIDSTEFSQGKYQDSYYIGILKLICEVCTEEYRFSYDEKYIRKLVVYRAQLDSYDPSKMPSTVYLVVMAAKKKVEFLLSKLARYSSNKTISYNIDFETQKITTNEEESQDIDDEYHDLCRYFNEPNKIPENLALQWADDIEKKTNEMWKIVYLMRYHCKYTFDKEQIDHLIERANELYNAYFRENKGNRVDNRAVRFFINYMYNSRFSFLCKHDETYGYDAMNQDLQRIVKLQEKTGIHNYHPYQKACEYLVDYIKERLRDTSYTESLQDEWKLLNDCYQRLKCNKDWCKVYQTYLMPLPYEFSTTKTKYGEIPVYFPSSVSRPLKFNKIEEKAIAIGNAVQWLELQIDHQPEKAKIVEAQAEIIAAKEKIGAVEKTNLKHMGYFITVTTFLIGLLSIFIGNQGGVSIYEKMEYVSALGIILLLFVFVGYIAVTENIKDKNKYWTLFGVGVALAAGLGWVAHIGYENIKTHQEKVIENKVVEPQKTVVEIKLDTLVVGVNAKVESEGHMVTITESPKTDNAKPLKK